MSTRQDLDHCLSFINYQLSPAHQPAHHNGDGWRRLSITLSRQTGSGAMGVAQKLAQFLQERAPGDCPWTVFDRNLMERVLEEHHLPKRLEKFLPEDSISMISDMVDELLGLHPPSWEVVRQTTETVLHLARFGHVILIGRGATAITAQLPNVFHARLVAPLEQRAARIQERNKLSRAEAVKHIRQSDRARARYLKKYLQTDIDDPLLYDLVVNTHRLSEEDVAMLIGTAALKYQPADAEVSSTR